jgi:glycosyltransferase involved in cell wall biosynthesis
VVFQLVPDGFAPSRLGRRIFAAATRVGQRWVATSESNRSALSDGLGIHADSIDVIFNGTTLPATPGAWDVRPSDAVERIRVITVARLDRTKGYLELLEAATAVCARRDDVDFVWVGDGPMSSALRAAVFDRGLSERIHLLGRRSDVPELLRSSKLFVLPSHFEGLSFALLEAMSAGVPIVATAVSSTPEVLEFGRCGLLVPVRDPDALTAAILQALAAPEETRKLTESALVRVREFSREVMTRKTVDLMVSMRSGVRVETG